MKTIEFTYLIRNNHALADDGTRQGVNTDIVSQSEEATVNRRSERVGTATQSVVLVTARVKTGMRIEINVEFGSADGGGSGTEDGTSDLRVRGSRRLNLHYPPDVDGQFSNLGRVLLQHSPVLEKFEICIEWICT